VHEVELFQSRLEEARLLEARIQEKATAGFPLRILEAGCGQRWPLRLDGIRYTLTGVDLDERALWLRKTRIGDLDESILGDLRSVRLPAGGYDIIYCSFVLEHVRGAEQVLGNFARWLRPGGLLILMIPDRNSVYGLLTRITPLWLHLFYWRHIRGYRTAGEAGSGPYPTYHERVVSREGIHSYCRRTGFQVLDEYGQSYYLTEGRKATRLLVRLLVRALALLSLGKLEWRYNDLTYVLEKAPGPESA
jgi:SAM-dependent methyltransferase